jgi:hypothetical protein
LQKEDRMTAPLAERARASTTEEDLSAKFFIYATTVPEAEDPRSLKQALYELDYLGFTPTQINSFKGILMVAFFSGLGEMSEALSGSGGSATHESTQDLNAFLGYRYAFRAVSPEPTGDGFGLDKFEEYIYGECLESLRAEPGLLVTNQPFPGPEPGG